MLVRDREGFQPPKSNRYLIRIWIMAGLVSAGIFAVLPFTQALSGDPRDRFRVRTVDLSPPPPPPPIEEEPPPPEEVEEEPPPEFDEPPPPLSLDQLEAALNPGIGSAIGQALNLDAFSVTGNVVEEMQIFSISDLDSRPRRLRAVAPEFPPEMQVSGATGRIRVRILIDENGEVTVMEVVEASHQEAVQPVRQALTRWRFEPPKKDGVRVRAQYIQPFDYDFSQ